MPDKIEIKVDLKQIKELSRRYPEASLAARRARVQEAVLLLEREIKLSTPEGAGPIHLRDTIVSSISIGEPVWGMVGTPAIHGEPVECGTKPHSVSEEGQEAILFWVEKKLGMTGKEAQSVTSSIVWAIRKRGTKGQHMFENAFKKHVSRVVRILNKIPADIVKAVGA